MPKPQGSGWHVGGIVQFAPSAICNVHLSLASRGAGDTEIEAEVVAVKLLKLTVKVDSWPDSFDVWKTGCMWIGSTNSDDD